jgi:NAD-dependent DNA ligase
MLRHAMSVNVDLDLRVKGGSEAALAAVEAFLEREELLDAMNRKAAKGEVRFSTAHPVELEKASAVQKLAKGLKALQTGAAVLVLRTRVGGGAWAEEELQGLPEQPALEPKARTNSRLTVHGKTVVLTGTVPGMQRKDVEARLTSLGARCTGSVSKKTDYLFAMADAGSKKEEARRLGVPVLDELVLFSLIGSPDKPKTVKPTAVSEEAREKVAERKRELGSGGFAGKTVVITGTLSRGRSEIAARLEAAGADVTGSVSANTHYLVTGAGMGATKLNKATALGVTIIDEPTMERMLSEG